MPHHVIERLMHALNDPPLRDGAPIFAPRALRGAHILVLGVAYKADIDDVRESPALEILELLEEKGAIVRYHDPYIPKVPRTRRHGDLQLASCALTDAELQASDCALIVTAHKSIDYARVVSRSRLVLDTRNACRDISDARIVKA